MLATEPEIMERYRKFPHLYRCGHIEGGQIRTSAGHDISGFPHLYRCGHIEGSEVADYAQQGHRNFRIFIDAATLKEKLARLASGNSCRNFRIFIDAATLKAIRVHPASVFEATFPHLYRCGHIEGPLRGEDE